MKNFGFGLMRLPVTVQDGVSRIDIEEMKRMADLFIEKGFTYFDTAWMYMEGQSENAVREAVVERYPRDAFTLTTKLHSSYVRSFEDRDRVFNEQLEKTGAGYFDYYLLHGINTRSIKIYEMYDCFNWLFEKKAQGLVKHTGFSFHADELLLDEILTNHPEIELVQLQLNYLDWESEWIRSRKCYETAVKHGKPVIVMEPVKGGALARLPEEAERMFRDHDPDMSMASWAIRFAASQPGVMMVLSGMSNLEQMKDNLSFMEDFIPLSEEEIGLCEKAVDIINATIAVPCTACSYCTDGCPMNIPIPKLFAIFNESMKSTPNRWNATVNNYLSLRKSYGDPADCLACGQCESVCPQHIHIIDELRKLVEHYRNIM